MYCCTDAPLREGGFGRVNAQLESERRKKMKGKRLKCLGMALCCMAAALPLHGCGDSASGKTEIEIVQYKPEAANYFKSVEEEFNATHDDIHLTISSPNDAMTILKTRFIREDYPDIIGIGGDINYSYFVDAEILTDVSGYEGLKEINQGYLDIAEALELVPTEGTYIVPYVANAAGILYNRDMFAEHGWQIPETWEELKQKIQEIKDETTIAALANKDYSDSFKKIKETANEVLKNKQIFNGAIEKTKNGENLDYDTVSALIELDPSLADKFIKTADGYRIAVDALIAANEKYVQSKGADSLKSKIEEANTEITKDRKAELAVLYINIKMLWRSLRAFKISIPNSNQILPESEKNTIPAKV